MILLHFFGLGDVLRRFELEQLTGLNLMGFRPIALDELVIWSQRVADQQRWDAERIHHDVLNLWIDQAEEFVQSLPALSMMLDVLWCRIVAE